jgi:WD40 repeat protein
VCCAYAKKRKNYVAVGDSHGNIAIYNIQKCVTTGNCSPDHESKNVENKHNDIVWEVKWITRSEREETLVSISGDGRIIEWSLRKGLELTDLYQLKRETNPNHKDVYAGADVEKKTGAMSFINTGGLSIDFPEG